MLLEHVMVLFHEGYIQYQPTKIIINVKKEEMIKKCYEVLQMWLLKKLIGTGQLVS